MNKSISSENFNPTSFSSTSPGRTSFSDTTNIVKPDDRREHTRYPLRAYAELGNSTNQWEAHLLDISYFGARVALLDEYQLSPGNAIRLRIEIPEKNRSEGMSPYLNLRGKLVHQQGHMLGIQYEPMNDSDANLLDLLLANLA